LNEPNRARRDTDLERLGRINALSWLSLAELTRLVEVLTRANFKRHELIVSENALASEAHILLTGAANITCLNARSERVTVALVAPGPIPEFPVLPISRWSFQCEAYTDCRVGSVGWERFGVMSFDSAQLAFRRFHQTNLRQWYRLLLRGSSFLSLDLHERIALTLLELCSDFGVEESRGTLLKIVLSHKQLANLVGASRPRVTEHLARLEDEGLVARQGRQLVVRAGRLGNLMNRLVA
jgi:CRP/FNR family cyclic AMP-dependent transcriptional regulator